MSAPVNICLCGTGAGYPHHRACPRPLFRSTPSEAEAWEREFRARLALVAPRTTEGPRPTGGRP